MLVGAGTGAEAGETVCSEPEPEPSKTPAPAPKRDTIVAIKNNSETTRNSRTNSLPIFSSITLEQVQ